MSEYRRHGLVALVRKKRLDRGQRRAVSEPIKEAIEGPSLQKPPLPTATLYRQVVKLQNDDADGWSVCGLCGVRDYAKPARSSDALASMSVIWDSA